MKSALLPLAALLVGLFVGTLVGSRFAPASTPARTPAADGPRQANSAAVERTVDTSLAPVSPARQAASTHETAARTDDTRAPGGELIDEDLRAYARSGIRAAWKQSRSDEIPVDRLERGLLEFGNRVLALPADIGRRLAEERTREELLARDAKAGGAFALLEKLARTPTPMPELASDPAAMEALFARTSPETAVRAEQLGKLSAKQIEASKTYVYPSGVFELALDFNGIQSVPEDVTIAGAGMNATLLVMSGNIFANRPLQRFSIRDCTVFTSNNYLFDQRTAPATVLLERVRVVGFDMGGGSSCALGFTGGLVLLARDCRFEGGYGRHPEHGQLMDLRSAGILRLERCRLDRLSLGAANLPEGSTLALWQCVLTDLLDWKVRFAASAERQQFEQDLRATPGLQFQDTTMSFFDNAAWNLAPTDWNVPARDLNELFPGWERALGR